MARFTNPGGHDMTDRINLDGLGTLLLTLTVIWTTILTCGIAFLVKHRDVSIIRMRRLELCIGAVVTLHVYWCACMLAYTVNGRFACATEFWIMSTFLPWGVAFYQLSNTQLLCVARQQQNFAKSRPIQTDTKGRWTTHGWRGILDVYRACNITSRTLVGLECGLAIQGCLTLILFLSSRKFHPSWGLFGQGVSKADCRLGFEWWPSFAWQLMWSWIYAPCLLWKIKSVKDVHAWRLQTVLCSVAGLPATPLWIASLHSTAFTTINKYWVPPLWFSPCIVVMEASAVFMPCWQILRNQSLHKDTLKILTEWETTQKDSSFRSSTTVLSTDSRSPGKPSGKTSTSKDRKLTGRRELYTMSALEKALEMNPTPLLLFASYRDFSGENISFLNRVNDWRAHWHSGPRSSRCPATYSLHNSSEYPALRHRQYAAALDIYSAYVSPQFSDFPVNLSSGHLNELHGIFSEAAAKVYCAADHNPATPFEDVTPWVHSDSHSEADLEPGFGHKMDSISVASIPSDGGTYGESDNIIAPQERTVVNTATRKSNLRKIEVRLPSNFSIPESFSPAIFDHAQASIKYLVFTSTWPKFVAEKHVNMLAHKGLLDKMREFVRKRVVGMSNMDRLG